MMNTTEKALIKFLDQNADDYMGDIQNLTLRTANKMNIQTGVDHDTCVTVLDYLLVCNIESALPNHEWIAQNMRKLDAKLAEYVK